MSPYKYRKVVWMEIWTRLWCNVVFSTCLLCRCLRRQLNFSSSACRTLCRIRCSLACPPAPTRSERKSSALSSDASCHRWEIMCHNWECYTLTLFSCMIALLLRSRRFQGFQFYWLIITQTDTRTHCLCLYLNQRWDPVIIPGSLNCNPLPLEFETEKDPVTRSVFVI